MTPRYALLGVLTLMTSAAMPQSAPVCMTHFYNQSNFQWSIANFDGRKSTLFIPPHTTLAISWGNTKDVLVFGNLPSHPYAQRFEVEPAGSCVVLRSRSSGELVSPNKPGNGDITTCAGSC